LLWCSVLRGFLGLIRKLADVVFSQQGSTDWRRFDLKKLLKASVKTRVRQQICGASPMQRA